MKYKIVNVYIDGFNVYHVIKSHINKTSKPWEPKLKWCNLYKLAESYLKEDEKLWKVYFFTADSWLANTRKKWVEYQKALNQSWVTVIKWQYSQIKRTFMHRMPVIDFILNISIPKEEKHKYIPKRLKYKTYEEKRTDVNIAVKILEDAFLRNYDRAIIMSWDSDIVPAIESVKRNFPKVIFTTLWITWTKWYLIKDHCDTHEIIWYKKMISCMFPLSIPTKRWENIKIPEEWLESVEDQQTRLL